MTKEAPLWSQLSLQNKMALLNQINALLDMDQEELENYFATATSAEEVDHPNLPIISQTVEEPESNVVASYEEVETTILNPPFIPQTVNAPKSNADELRAQSSMSGKMLTEMFLLKTYRSFSFYV